MVTQSKEETNMPVKPTPTGFNIELKCEDPTSDYIETMRDLIDLMRDRDEEMSQHQYFYASELLKQMLPTYDQAKLIFVDVVDND